MFVLRERERIKKKVKFHIQFKNLKIRIVEKVKISKIMGKIIALLMKMIILDLIFRF